MISISRTNAENRFAAIEKIRQKALGEQEEIALKVRKKPLTSNHCALPRKQQI